MFLAHVFTRLDLLHREQWEAEVADLDKQTVQCSLVGNRPTDERFTVGPVLDGKPAEPFPSRFRQMSAYANFIDDRYVPCLAFLYLV